MKAKRILSLIIAIMLSVGLIGCDNQSGTPEKTAKPKYTSRPTATPAETEEVTYEFEMADLGDNVSVHTANQAGYLADSLDSIGNYAPTEEGGCKPKPVHFTWNFEAPDGGKISSYYLYVVEDGDAGDNWCMKTANNYYDVYNLKVGTKYYWYVVAHSGYEEYKSQKVYFSTEDNAPRMLYIDGLSNVRDLGGWKTENGGRMKQGLVFRCCKMNDNGGPHAIITEKGIEAFKGQLRVKTEIDLRPADRAYVTVSVLGSDVNHFVVGMTNKGNIFLDQSEQIKEVLTIFADESNYPIAFHCNGGTERAGVIAFVLEGLCGMSADDICRDYMMSNFTVTNGSYWSYQLILSYLEEVKKAGGDTLADQFKNYLLGIGMTNQQLDEIVRIMTEKQ